MERQREIWEKYIDWLLPAWVLTRARAREMHATEVRALDQNQTTFLNKASSDRQREQLHQAHCLYGAMKTHYLTDTTGKKHFTIVENYSCPGSAWLNTRAPCYHFCSQWTSCSPGSLSQLSSFPLVTSRGYWWSMCVTLSCLRKVMFPS